MLDAARRDEKLTGPGRDITVSHLDGDLAADDREELAGYRSGRCQLNSPWTCTIRESLLIDFVVFVLRPVELTVHARHERVVVVNRERPAIVILHPDAAAGSPTARRGRPLREALGLLAGAALPDPGFADDMEAVLADVGPAPDDPWARS